MMGMEKGFGTVEVYAGLQHLKNPTCENCGKHIDPIFDGGTWSGGCDCVYITLAVRHGEPTPIEVFWLTWSATKKAAYEHPAPDLREVELAKTVLETYPHGGGENIRKMCFLAHEVLRENRLER